MVPKRAKCKMGDKDKAKDQLIKELAEIRQEVAILKASEEERKRADEALKKSGEYLDNIITSMNDSLFVVDPDAKIKTINKATSDLLGYREEELIGKPVAAIFAEEEEEEEEEEVFTEIHLKELIRKGSLTNKLVIYQAKDGEKIPVIFNGAVMRDSKGKIIAVVGIARDDRERRKLEAQLIQSGKMVAMGQLVAGVSHELNNPLSIIKSYADYLRGGLDNGKIQKSEIKKCMKAISQNVNRSARIVDHLKEFSRQSKDRRSLVDVRYALKMALKLFRAQLGHYNIRLAKRFKGDNFKVRGDLNRLEQVFVNLLMNAKDAIDANGNGGQISINIEESNGEVNVIVKDNGIGIPDKYINDIFNPFFTTKDVGKGIGLGLSLTHDIVCDHGGSIKVESTEGKGSCFVVSLPIVSAKKLQRRKKSN